MYTCICMYVCIYIYIVIYVYMCIYIYIHTHIAQRLLLQGRQRRRGEVVDVLDVLFVLEFVCLALM